MTSKSNCSARSMNSSMVMPDSNGGLLIRAKWWHQLSSTRSTSTAWPSITAWKFSLRARCQPGAQARGELVARGVVGAHTDRARRALEHVEVLRGLRQRRDGLHGAGPGSDDPDGLVGQLRHGLVGTTTGVLVVPTRGMERAALERLHPRDHRQLHQVEDPDRHHQIPSADLVAPIGSDHPTRPTLVPLARLHTGVEQRRIDEIEPVGDRLEVFADLLTEGVPRLRDVTRLLEHRHVAVRLDVAHHTRIAVPVPGPADTAGVVDHADAIQTRLAQVGTGHHARHPRTDDRDVDVLDHRITPSHGRERIRLVLREHLVTGQIPDRGPTLHGAACHAPPDTSPGPLPDRTQPDRRSYPTSRERREPPMTCVRAYTRGLYPRGCRWSAARRSAPARTRECAATYHQPKSSGDAPVIERRRANP